MFMMHAKVSEYICGIVQVHNSRVLSWKLCNLSFDFKAVYKIRKYIIVQEKNIP